MANSNELPEYGQQLGIPNEPFSDPDNGPIPLQVLQDVLDAANLVIEAKDPLIVRVNVDALEHKLDSLGVGL